MKSLAVLGALAFSLPARAAEAAPAYATGWGSLLQGLFGLLVVLGLLYGFLVLLRRFGAANSGVPGVVKVVGGVMLSPRERLVMVEVRDTWLLVGVASGHVSLVHSMPKPADAATFADTAPAPFAEKLARMLQRDGKN
jgi:flagellar protein FliO/FliZ